MNSGVSEEPHVRWGPDPLTGRNTFESDTQKHGQRGRLLKAVRQGPQVVVRPYATVTVATCMFVVMVIVTNEA